MCRILDWILKIFQLKLVNCEILTRISPYAKSFHYKQKATYLRYYTVLSILSIKLGSDMQYISHYFLHKLMKIWEVLLRQSQTQRCLYSTSHDTHLRTCDITKLCIVYYIEKCGTLINTSDTHFSTLFRGVVPSEPPTTYSWLFNTATATPSLLAFMLAMLVHRFDLGSYLTTWILHYNLCISLYCIVQNFNGGGILIFLTVSSYTVKI